AVIGGYGNLLAGSSGRFETMLRLVLIVCYALPAILPPLAILLWGGALWRSTLPKPDRARAALLVLSTGAMILTALPRPDVMHLGFVAALPFALTGAGLARIFPLRVTIPLAFASMFLGIVFAANLFTGWSGAARIASPVGELRVPPPQAADF